jgi:hypothetical protein
VLGETDSVVSYAVLRHVPQLAIEGLRGPERGGTLPSGRRVKSPSCLRRSTGRVDWARSSPRARPAPLEAVPATGGERAHAGGILARPGAHGGRPWRAEARCPGSIGGGARGVGGGARRRFEPGGAAFYSARPNRGERRGPARGLPPGQPPMWQQASAAAPACQYKSVDSVELSFAETARSLTGREERLAVRRWLPGAPASRSTRAPDRARPRPLSTGPSAVSGSV